MEYLIKSAAIISIFYVCYKFLLQHETFFQNNRRFLTIGIIATIILPFVSIPIYETIQSQNAIAFSTIEAVPTTPNLQNDPSILWNFDYILFIIYTLGVIVFGLRLLIQIFSLATLLIRSEKYRSGKYIYVTVSDDVSPFSFFNWIVFNPNQFSTSELEQIITHEKVHANQLHSVDILLIQVASVVFWCNPLIWLYKKEMEHNLEYIADFEAQNQLSCEKSYQHLLLKTSVPNYQMALTNNFYNSLIKKRIIMLHKSKSNRLNAWKYVLILPALALFLMSFSTTTIYVEDPTILDLTPPINVTPALNESHENVFTLQPTEVVLITKDFSDADLEKLKKELLKQGITVKFKGVKRNKQGEIIAIKIEAKSKTSNVNYNTNSDEPIAPIKISFSDDGSSMSIGNSQGLHGKDYYFTTADGKTKIHSNKKKHNIYVYEDEDHDEDHDDDDDKDDDDDDDDDDDEREHVIIHSGKNKFKVRASENVHIESDGDGSQEKENIFIIKKDEDGKEIKKEIILKLSNDDEWHTDEEEDGDRRVIIKTLDDDSLFSESSDHHGASLIIYNGKEISKEELSKLDSDLFTKVKILKGDKAVEKYGAKAKDGVMLISTEDKK